ncbi:MAG: hypothetical protein V4819_05085 [Verrucomicrobiota bacterium]
MSASGTTGTVMFHLLKLASRVFIFLLIVAVGGWVYLVKVTGTKKFNDNFKASLQEGLSASEIELNGFSQSHGQLGINRLSCQGGNKTFFTSLEARNVRCKMGLLDGIAGKWDTGTISISMLDLELRAGADDPESAQLLSKALFQTSPRVAMNTLDVADANLRWGYSDRTRGAIENSVLKVQRVENGMKLNFKGGTFSQNWLRKLEIVNLVIACDPDGLTFEKAEFQRDLGTVDLSGLKVVGGERPMIEGTAKIRKLAMEDIVPAAVRTFIEGAISGDFQVSGSTNSTDGVGFEGQVTLKGEDSISLRKRIHLLDALSTVDFVRNYHRVDFREGSFHLKTSGGGMDVTDAKLKAEDLFTLEGKMRVRLPTPEETKAAMESSTGPGSSPIFNGEDAEADPLESKGEELDFTLDKAGKVTKRPKDKFKPENTTSLSSRLALSLEARRLDAQASERLSRTLRYEGEFGITIPADAFERAPRLMQLYPLDPKLNRIPMTVPIEGTLYELTLKQAEDLYKQARR